MTSRPLTDAQLAVGLRAHLPEPDADLDRRIRATILTTGQQRPLPSVLGRLTDADPIGRRRTTLVLALIGLALAASAVATAGTLLRDDRAPDLSVLPAEPTPWPTLGPHVGHWPSTSRNGPGDYSWGGGCGGFCSEGFMHNGYGSADVEIRIMADPIAATIDDWTPTTVAGAPGWYRQPEERVEEWQIHIGASAITIRLTARPGTSQQDLAEAHAIIESIRPVTSDDERGYRLVFTLVSGDWDSG